MVSELRSRKVKASEETPLESDKENCFVSTARPFDKHDKDAGSFRRRLFDWDRAATSKCGICASPDSGYDRLRYIFKALEISGEGVPWIAVPLALMYYSDDPWVRELMLNLLAGTFLDLLVNIVIKASVRRPRPSINQNDMVLTVSVDSKFSFPSGHSSKVGMLVFFFLANFTLTALQTSVLLLWTLGIAFSRLCLGRHYVSDVVCGILIGLLQGIFIQRYWMPVENLENLEKYFSQL